MFKKIALILSLLLILSSCWSTAMESVTSKQWFQISYPTWWTLTDTGDAISFIDKKTKTIIVASKSVIQTPKSDQEIIDWYKTNGSVENSGKILFGTRDATFVEFTNTYGKLSYFHKDAWTMKSGNIYTVGCTINSDSVSDMKDVCTKVMESLIIPD